MLARGQLSGKEENAVIKPQPGKSMRVCRMLSTCKAELVPGPFSICGTHRRKASGDLWGLRPCRLEKAQPVTMKDFLDRLGIVPSPTEEASQLLQVSNRVEIG